MVTPAFKRFLFQRMFQINANFSYDYIINTNLNRWYKEGHMNTLMLRTSLPVECHFRNQDSLDEVNVFSLLLSHLLHPYRIFISFFFLCYYLIGMWPCSVFLCCSSSATRSNVLWIQRYFSVYLRCKSCSLGYYYICNRQNQSCPYL